MAYGLGFEFDRLDVGAGCAQLFGNIRGLGDFRIKGNGEDLAEVSR